MPYISVCGLSIHRQLLLATVIAIGSLGCKTVAPVQPNAGSADTVNCGNPSNEKTCIECGKGGKQTCCADAKSCKAVDMTTSTPQSPLPDTGVGTMPQGGSTAPGM
jgi:hypothetical protein